MRRSTSRYKSTIGLFWLFSAIVALSMILALIAPVLTNTDTPTPTPPPPTPTWTPIATSTWTPTVEVNLPLVVHEATPTPAPQDFTFAVCGDSRDGPEVYQQILQMVQQDGSAFLIHTGDLVSHGTEEEFQQFQTMMASFSLPFYPVPGNHDNPDGLLEAYLTYSGAPAAHYSFDYGQAHFAFIDTSVGSFPSWEQNWLEEDLAATDQPLRFVVLHHPPFDPDGTDHIMAGGNEAFMELMDRYDVDYVLAGHIHAFAQAERNGTTYNHRRSRCSPLFLASPPSLLPLPTLPRPRRHSDDGSHPRRNPTVTAQNSPSVTSEGEFCTRTTGRENPFRQAPPPQPGTPQHTYRSPCTSPRRSHSNRRSRAR